MYSWLCLIIKPIMSRDKAMFARHGIKITRGFILRRYNGTYTQARGHSLTAGGKPLQGII